MRFTSLHALLVGTILGTGCSDGGTASYTLIDDMEGEVNQIAWPAPDGALPGRWGSTTDCTQADRISPSPYLVDPDAFPYADLSTEYETFSGVTSTRAARLRTTTPLVGVWGANIILSLSGTDPSSIRAPGAPPDGEPCRQDSALNYPAPAVDLTAYSGITFWAKAEPGGARTVHVQVIDRNVDPRGGICNAAHPDDDDDCYNGYRTSVVLSDTFTRYTIDFSTLAQNPTWGFRPEPSVLDLAHVYVMNFEFAAPTCEQSGTTMCAGGAMPPLSFDLWLDDLYFVNK